MAFFFYIEIFTNKEKQSDMIYDRVQDVDLEFGFNWNLLLK